MANRTSSSGSKPKALSLHIGLNAVSPAAYGGWSGELAACEFDAKDMAAIAKSQGMKSTVLLTKQGTRAGMLAAMRKAAKQLKKGDLFSLPTPATAVRCPTSRERKSTSRTRPGASTTASSSTTSCISN